MKFQVYCALMFGLFYCLTINRYCVVMCLFVCSVVENMPPVVLTDEEICLEVVERSDSAS